MYGMKTLDTEAGSEQIGVLRPLPQAAARHTSSESDDEEALVGRSPRNSQLSNSWTSTIFGTHCSPFASAT